MSSRNDTWSQVVDYFNYVRRTTAGACVHRRTFLDSDRIKGNYSTIETYRAYLTRAGYIETVAPGVYFVPRLIPLTLTMTKCYNKAYRELNEIKAREAAQKEKAKLNELGPNSLPQIS